MRALVVASLLLAVATPSLAGGADTLSGVWQGSLSCKTADDGGKAKLSSGPSLLLIDQAAPGGPLDMNFVAKGFGSYSGRASPFALERRADRRLQGLVEAQQPDREDRSLLLTSRAARIR